MDLTASIARAKRAGYSDAEITAHLASDPALAPKLKQARAAGYGDADIVRHLAGAPAPRDRAVADARRQTKGSDDVGRAVNAFGQGMTLGFGDEITGAANAVATGAQNALAGFGIGKPAGFGMRDAYSAGRQVFNEEQGGFHERHPVADTALQVAGGFATPGVGAAGAFVKSAATAGQAVRRAALVGGAFGAAAGAGNADGSVNNRLAGAVGGAATGAVVGGALGGVGARLAARRISKINPDVALLAREGVQMTPGQMNGQFAKRTEEAARSVPIMGDAIISAQQRGVESFNRAVLNRALKPIGETLPKEVGVGHDGIKHVGDTLSTAYEQLIPKGGVRSDPELAAGMQAVSDITATLTPDSLNRLKHIVGNRVISRVADNAMDGRTYQQVQSELKNEIGRFSASPDPDHRGIGDALKVISTNLSEAAARQNPEFATQKNRLDTGWSHLALAESAASKAGAEGGVFSPKQYAAAARAANQTVRRRGVARGEALGQDLATAGERILSNKLPDSGTPRRLMSGMTGLAGGGAAFAAGGPVGFVGSAALLGGGAAAYGRQAQALANRLLTQKLSRIEQQQALGQLKTLASRYPAIRRLYGSVAGQLPRSPGANLLPLRPAADEDTQQRR